VSNTELTLTPTLIANWRDERERLRAEINDKLKHVQWLDERIKAAETLLPSMPQDSAPHFRISADTGTVRAGDDAGTSADNMTAAIVEIVKTLGQARITHAALRQKLRSKGFPETRLGNYYYTAVHRLKEKGRITIDPSGAIGGGIP
jgi:hypothetical protein